MDNCSESSTVWLYTVSRPDNDNTSRELNDDSDSNVQHPSFTSVTLKDENVGEEDFLDKHNHPRLRRTLIRNALRAKESNKIRFIFPKERESCFKDLYSLVHCPNMLKFLDEGWDLWVKLGPEGRDEGNIPNSYNVTSSGDSIPPFIPTSAPLHRDKYTQRAGVSILGQIGYYCIDTLTPIVSSLREELLWDAAIVRTAVETSISTASSSSTEVLHPCNHRFVTYAVTTHPGHHSSYESYGGYCYLNHAAMAARLFQQTEGYAKVAILDVDYHCGNGTASIFYDDPTVLVVSIHCDPAYEYPFHSGYADETGVQASALGTTLHIPLPPHTYWEGYKNALIHAMQYISDKFEPDALVVSLGLDTYDGDQVAVRRAGFHLKEDDYKEMGRIIGTLSPKRIPIVVVQEGGYLMTVVGQAASDVVTGISLLE